MTVTNVSLCSMVTVPLFHLYWLSFENKMSVADCEHFRFGSSILHQAQPTLKSNSQTNARTSAHLKTPTAVEGAPVECKSEPSTNEWLVVVLNVLKISTCTPPSESIFFRGLSRSPWSELPPPRAEPRVGHVTASCATWLHGYMATWLHG